MIRFWTSTAEPKNIFLLGKEEWMPLRFYLNLKHCMWTWLQPKFSRERRMLISLPSQNVPVLSQSFRVGIWPNAKSILDFYSTAWQGEYSLVSIMAFIYIYLWSEVNALGIWPGHWGVSYVLLSKWNFITWAVLDGGANFSRYFWEEEGFYNYA